MRIADIQCAIITCPPFWKFLPSPAVEPPAISSGLGVGGKLSGLLSAAAVVEGALEATFDPLVVFDFEMQTLLG